MTDDTLTDLFRKLILANELDNNLSAALRFSDAGGKSGYSFGVCQFDLSNNDSAAACLKECGFSEPEICALKAKSIPPRDFTQRLVQHQDIIERYDENQLSHCLEKVLAFQNANGIVFESPDGILAAADYCNQYGSMGKESAAYYSSLKRPVTAQDVLNFKLKQTKYGREHPADCRRRYDNLVKLLQAESARTC